MGTNPTQTEQLRQLFAEHGGHLNSGQVRRTGLPLKAVQRLVQRGEVQVLQRGVYHLVALGTPAHADLLEVQLRVPYARPALVTALDLHGLTTTRPVQVQVAIPANRTFPDLDFPPVQVFWYPPGVYGAGAMEWRDGASSFITYTPEKTLADLLRLESRLGRDIYLEGLKNYLKRPDRNIPELLDMARVGRVEATLRRDLEVLTHEANH